MYIDRLKYLSQNWPIFTELQLGKNGLLTANKCSILLCSCELDNKHSDKSADACEYKL